MKLFSKKALALVLTLAMLMSCMVFSFSADADVSLVCKNNYDDGNETNWLSKYGSGSSHADNSDNYAKYYDDDGNGTMLLGFGTNGHSGYGMSGYWFYADSAYDEGVGDVRTLSNAKYMIQFKYKLKSIHNLRSDVSVAIKFGLAPRYNFYYNPTDGASKKRSDFLSTTSTKGLATNVVTVGADDLSKGWQTAVGFLDITAAEVNDWRPHIFATLGGGYQDSLSGTEILIDEVYIYKYDSLSDVAANPNAVSDLMWENDFSNPDSTNWGKYLSNTAGDHWDYNFHSSPEGMAYNSKSSAGNYALLENGYVKMGFGTNEAAESNISVFFLKHQYKTADTSAASAGSYYGHRGTRTSDSQPGDFVPAAGKYAIKFDYQVKSFNAASASSVNIGAGYFTSEKYLDGNRTLTNLAGYTTLLTVDASDVSTEWKTAVGFIEAPSNIWGGLMMYAAVANNGAELTESEVLVDNIEIYGMGTFPTVSVMYNGSSVGSADGLPGYPVTLPAVDSLSMSVPDGYAAAYYSDAECTTPAADVICGNTGATVYAGLVKLPKQALYENAFNNPTDTNWNSRLGKASGWISKGSITATALSDGAMELTLTGDATNAAGTDYYTSGFQMYDQDTVDGSVVGAFAVPAGYYVVQFDYKVTDFTAAADASLDIMATFAKDYYWDGSDNPPKNKLMNDGFNNSKYPVSGIAATVTASDKGGDWVTVTKLFTLEGDVTRNLHIHIKAHSGFSGSMADTKVLIDNVKLYQYDINFDQTVKDRTAYLYKGNAGTEDDPIWTNLHSYVGNGEKEGVYTSLRLAAKYTAGDSTGSTIIIDGVEYELVERGILVGVEGSALDLNNRPTYQWKASKTENFDQYWEPNPVVESDEPTEITFTLRLANMGEAWFTDTTKYQFRSYYKVKAPDFESDEGFLVYGGISEAKTFGEMADTFTKAHWFPSLTPNS